VLKWKITAVRRREITAAPDMNYKDAFLYPHSSLLLLLTTIAAENEGIGRSIPNVVWYCC
jgi:hypothetical protein